MTKNEQKPKTNRFLSRFMGILGAIFGLFLLNKTRRRTKREVVVVPRTEPYIDSQEKVHEAISEVNTGPTKVKPTEGKTLEELRKEYDDL